MARVTSWPGHRAKTEEEFSREQNGRPEIEPHAKTEEGTEWHRAWGYGDRRIPCEGGGDADPRKLAPWDQHHATEAETDEDEKMRK